MRSPFAKPRNDIMPLEGLSPEAFIVIAYEAMKKLNGELAYVSPGQLVYYTPESEKGEREIVGMTFDGVQAAIISKAYNSSQNRRGTNERNVAAFRSAFNEVRASMGPEEISERFSALAPQFSLQDQTPEFLDDSSLKGFLHIFIPSGAYFITPLIININILVFIVMCATGVNIMDPDTGDLLAWGGSFRSYVTNGEWWRLLTSMFLHGGIIHLLMNMYAMLYIGILLEPLLGRTRFLAAYLLSGVCGGLLSIAMHSFTVGVGASGAIFGMYGVFLAMLTTNLIEKKARNAMLQNILLFILFNLAYGMTGNIDNAAHLGGLLSGMAIGYAYFPGLKKGAYKSPAGVIMLMTVAIAMLTVFTLRSLTDTIAIYDKRMKEFSANEEMALKMYHLPADSQAKDILLRYISDGIGYWQKDKQIIEDLDKLDLPEVLKTRDSLLKTYCELRIKTYEMLYKATTGNYNEFTEAIDHNNQKIDSVLRQLKE